MEKSKKAKYIIIVIVLLFAAIVIGAILWYNISLGPVSKNSEQIKVNIQMGSNSNIIARNLKEKDLIKSVNAFKIYIKLNNISNFQAGEYTLNKNMDIKQIVESLQTGVVFGDSTKITFLEGKTIRWYAKEVAENTDFTEEDVYLKLEDEEYINSLIQKYWFLTDDIKNEDIYYPLEGYLWPDTYYFEKENLTIETIFEKLLDQTEKKLEKYKEKMLNNDLSIHQIMTLASMVEMEGTKDEARKDIASVFYNRLEKNMSLGSDVTTYYAAKIEVGERDLYANELNTYNPYNTRGPGMAGKLPIGPISSVGESSIEACLNPNKTNYLYFVADKDGNVYFTRTSQEHTEKIKELKNSGMWFEF